MAAEEWSFARANAQRQANEVHRFQFVTVPAAGGESGGSA
jgi:hypothetical protein